MISWQNLIDLSFWHSSLWWTYIEPEWFFDMIALVIITLAVIAYTTVAIRD